MGSVVFKILLCFFLIGILSPIVSPVVLFVLRLVYAFYCIFRLLLCGLTYPLTLLLRARGYQIRSMWEIWGKQEYQAEQQSVHTDKIVDPIPEFDPYQTLGVGKTATIDQIKHAYRDLMKMNHPDRVASLDKAFTSLANERVLKIQKAYETLRS